MATDLSDFINMNTAINPFINRSQFSNVVLGRMFPSGMRNPGSRMGYNEREKIIDSKYGDGTAARVLNSKNSINHPYDYGMAERNADQARREQYFAGDPTADSFINSVADDRNMFLLGREAGERAEHSTNSAKNARSNAGRVKSGSMSPFSAMYDSAKYAALPPSGIAGRPDLTSSQEMELLKAAGVPTDYNAPLKSWMYSGIDAAGNTLLPNPHLGYGTSAMLPAGTTYEEALRFLLNGGKPASSRGDEDTWNQRRPIVYEWD